MLLAGVKDTSERSVYCDMVWVVAEEVNWREGGKFLMVSADLMNKTALFAAPR